MSQLKRVLLLTALICIAAPADAQTGNLPEPRNAALRYWMAFALMRDASLDPATSTLMENVLSGSAGWDERLAPIVEANLEAIQTMQRATKLPDCDWALEYELGPQAPVAHLAKARALARLNVLYGVRMAARHEGAKAAEAWLAGLRFSEHLAQDAPLFGTLTAKSALVSVLRAIGSSLHSGELDSTSASKQRDAVKSLPEYGFDWSRALSVDTVATEMGLRQFLDSPNPGELYRTAFGKPMPASYASPTEADFFDYQAAMKMAAFLLQLPYASAKQALPALQAKLTKLNPIIQQSIPSLARINDAREEIAVERAKVLKENP
jgi:hypothetical protein